MASSLLVKIYERDSFESPRLVGNVVSWTTSMWNVIFHRALSVFPMILAERGRSDIIIPIEVHQDYQTYIIRFDHSAVFRNFDELMIIQNP